MSRLSAQFKHTFGINGPSGFGSASTAEQVAAKYTGNIKGKTVVVTGATSGIGTETAFVLARHGAKVYACARTQEKGDALVAQFKKDLPQADVHVLVMDMESLDSVRAGAQSFKALHIPLDILVNNAGVMDTPKELRTKEGFEFQFGINHLAHFLFTELLIPELKAAKKARIVNVSSVGQWLFAPASGTAPAFNMEQLYPLGNYTRYGISKLANVQYSRELTRRYAADGITAYSLHPGNIATNLLRYRGLTADQSPILTKIFNFVMMLKTVEQGAATTLYAAVADEVVPGEHYTDVNVDHIFVHAKAADAEQAKQLWEYSAKLTKP